MQRLLHIVLWFLSLSGTWNLLAQESEAELKTKANTLFAKQEYVAATQPFLQLLALQPRSPEYNYKYGTCLLFNSKKKSEAIKYLEFATASGGVDIEAFYYMGKAYHLNYQFEEAIKFYNLYKTNSRGKPNKELEVDRQIEMCENGRRLLKKITDIIVLEKKEYAYAEFYALYDLKEFGGEIIVSSRDQSKLDKKKGFMPIAHFPPGARQVFFASYGDNESNGRQIYVKRRLPEGGWSVPEPVKGEVNTPYDEDFPYLDPKGEYLYFSSKGHNSMGGFDVFKSKYDPATNAFGKPENVDFAISSADNDLFYIVDSLDQNAWFASTRQSQDGNISVYKVKVDRLSVPIAAISGTFTSAVHPDNKKFNIEVKDLASGRQIGTFFSRPDGSYLIALPKGGKYEYTIKITGSPQPFKAVVNVPQLNELRPLKQLIRHEEDNAKEIVKVIDLFDETVEGAEGLLADILQMRAELNPNASQFDLKALDNPAGKQALADLGMGKLSPLEARDQVMTLAKTQGENARMAEDVQQKAIARTIENAAEIKSLQAEYKNKVNATNTISDPVEKYEIYTEAEKKSARITALEQENQKLLGYTDSLTKVVQSGQKQAASAKKLEQQLAQASDETQIIKVLTENKAQVRSLKEENGTLPTEKLVQEILKLKSDLDQLVRSRDSYQASANNLQNEIGALEARLNAAKAKDKPGIQTSIDAKKNELELITGEIRALDKKIGKITVPLDQKEDQLEYLQSLQKEKTPSRMLTASEAKKVVESTENQNYKTLKSYVAQQKAELEKNPALADREPVKSNGSGNARTVAQRSSEHDEKLRSIESDPKLTAEQKLRLAQAEDERLRSETTQEIARTEEALKQNPSDAKAKETLKSLQEVNKKTQERINAREPQIAAAEPTATTSPEVLVKQVKPALDKKLDEIANDPNLSVIEQLKMAQSEEMAFEGQLSEAIEALESKIARNPSDQAAKSQLKTLQQLKKQVAENIDNRSLAITSLDPENDVKVEKPSRQEVLASVQPGHEDRLSAIESNPNLSTRQKQEQAQAEDQKLQASVNAEIRKAETALKKNPNDGVIQARYELLQEIRQEVDNRIESRKAALSQPEQVTLPENTVPVDAMPAGSVVAQVKPGHEERLASIAADDLLSPQEKQNKLIQEEAKLQKALDAALRKEEKTLAKDPADAQALAARTQLTAAKEASQDRESEARQVLTAEAKSTVKPAELLARTDKNYQLDIQRIENGDSPDEREQLIARERSSQDMLKAQIRKNEAQLAKKENPALAAENQVLSELIDASEKRIETLSGRVVTENTTPEASTVQVTPTAVRSEKLGANAGVMTDKPASPEALKKQSQLLQSYQSELEILISENKAALAKDPSNKALQANRDVYQQEREAVVRKRKETDAAIAKLPATTLDPVAETIQSPVNTTVPEPVFSDHPDMRALLEERAALQQKLNDPGTPEREKPGLRKEIAGNEARQVKVENSLKEEQVRDRSIQAGSEVAAAKQNIPAGEAGNKASAVINSVQQSEQSIAAQLKATRSEKDPVAKQELLNQAIAKQSRNEEKIMQLKADQALGASVEKLQESDPSMTIYKMESAKDLENRRRRGVIEIGELENDIAKLDEEIRSLKRSAAKPLTAERDAKRSELTVLQDELSAVESELSKRRQAPVSVFNEAAINENITYEEERNLAASEPYKRYAQTAQQAAVIRKSIKDKTTQLEALKAENHVLILQDADKGTTENRSATEANLVKIAALTKEIAADQARLTEKKNESDQIINESKEPMKLQNLVARGVEPIRALTVAAALVPLPSNGFEIASNPGTAPVKTSIPVGVEVPSGLVYRVQVGAFAKPVREELFKEFNPVSGEKMNSGITRYMAGYFNSRAAVMSARSQIQALGYADAFPVAYCDGQRISMQEARRLEESGMCVPQGMENIVLQASASTAQIAPSIADTSRRSLPPLSNPGAYNQAPGAAKAIAVETRLGLFFTVQIGVYNRPVPATQIKNMEPLITKRLANGQIRYSAGIFQSVEGALPKKKEAVARGINDAYVTAYYKGERISLDEARKLLAELGNGILEKENRQENKIIAEEQIRRIEGETRTQQLKAEQELAEKGFREDQVQFVSSKSYDAFPRELLKRFNENGSFFYDAEDRKIKSIIYKNEDYVPQVYYFRKEIDTVYLPKSDTLSQRGAYEVTARIPGNELTGAMGEWLIRMGYQREIRHVDGDKMIQVRVSGIREEATYHEIMDKMRSLGFSLVVREQ